MFKSLTLQELMDLPLPSLTAQKRLLFRPDLDDVKHVYNLLNEKIFNDTLNRPNIILGKCRGYWGMCYGETKPYKNGSYCKIKLSDKWYSAQWMIVTLAHEMSHQYQWDNYTIMNHGPSFYRHQFKLYRYDIPLKRSYSTGRWFDKQDLFQT